MPFAVEARALTHAYGARVALDRVDLLVREGGAHGYVGANGAGKSTTMRILATLLAPTSGTVRVMGHDVATEPAKARRVVGYLSDDGGACCPGWSSREYLGAFARYHGIARPSEAAEAALGRVGLELGARARPLAKLSTGMRRRVELARALLGAPRLLLLDEPTRGLDFLAKRETWALLRELNGQGVTLLVSSHEVAELEGLCDDLTVLSKGRVAFRGPLANLPSDPTRREAALARYLAGAPAGGL